MVDFLGSILLDLSINNSNIKTLPHNKSVSGKFLRTCWKTVLYYNFYLIGCVEMLEAKYDEFNTFSHFIIADELWYYHAKTDELSIFSLLAMRLFSQ